MQADRETIREAGQLIEPWRALNRGFAIQADAARALILALLELPSMTHVRSCVADLLAEARELPTPAEIHAWRRANAPRRRECPKCDGTGNVAVEPLRAEGEGPRLVFARCECTRRAGEDA